MSDSSPPEKKSGLPSWQLKSSAASLPSSESQESPEVEATDVSRAATLETARKFLDDEKVRDAPTEEKMTFLEGKGLDKDIITKLLGVSRNSEASSAQAEQPSTTATSPPQISPSTATPTAPQTIPESLSTRLTSSSQSRDPAPVISYPEFLTKPADAAPLITTSRILTTLYLFGGLSAILYGTTTYLIEPMVANLTEARLSLASTAQTNLDKLISKLEGIVSHIPQTPKPILNLDPDTDSDSDPTEMFHRDIGVQTSLPTTPNASRPQSPSPQPQNDLQQHTSRLASLTGYIKELNEGCTSEGQDATELTATVDMLREYLTGLAYVAPVYNYGNTYGSVDKKEADDEISKLKASIRQVKGVLLSAKTFPGGTGAVKAR